MPRGVVAFAPFEKPFTVVGIGKRKFTIRRRQLPLTAGCLSSVYRSQGQTMRTIILDIRNPPGNRMDPAAVYVTLSRATCLMDTYLLFPVTLENLNKPRNKDVVALIEYLERLDKATFSAFLQDPTRFTPASASLAALAD
ncbi:unnamed protein product, partial [Ectocarpus sp. 4 AP-2014]